MNNISRRNFALLEFSQCIKPSVGLLHYVVAVHCPSEVLRKMDTEELNNNNNCKCPQARESEVELIYFVMFFFVTQVP